MQAPFNNRDVTPIVTGPSVQGKDTTEQLLILANGTIRLTGTIQLTGESSSLFSESFVVRSGSDGVLQIRHQIFKVHKPQSDEGATVQQLPGT